MTPSIGPVSALPRLSSSSALLLAVPGVVLAAWGLLFAAGGLAPGAGNLIAAGTTLPAAVVLGLIAGGRWPYARPPAATLVAAGGLALFAIVAAASSLWSLSTTASLDDAILASGYLGALALGVLLGPTLARPGTVFTAGITIIATVASLAALIGRSFPGTTGIQFTPRLSGTLSLPNALAVLTLAGVFGGLALCAHGNPRWRAVGGSVIGLNMLALVLTSSRSGLGIALLGIMILQLILPTAPRMRLVGIFAAIPAVLLGFRIATWQTFAEITTVADMTKVATAAGWGLVFATIAVAVLGALIAVLAVRVLPGADPAGHRGRASRRTLLIAGALLLLLITALVIRTGGPVGTVEAIRAGFTGPVGQGGVRIGIGSNLRDHWWATAWQGFAERPAQGWGAGTFRLLEETTRNPARVTDSAHHAILEALAGTGLLGGIPFLVGGGALVGMAVGGIRRARPEDAIGAAVVAVGGGAFLTQGLVDVDWSLAAQGVLAYASIGAIAAQRSEPSPIPPPGRIAAGALCVVLLVAGLLALPFWLGERQAEQSTGLLGVDPQKSLELAVSAERYNPWAVAPLLAEADAREALGDRTGAQAALIKAIDQEPFNFEPWLVYGTYLAFSWDQPEAGRAALSRALRLSGSDPAIQNVLESVPAP